MREEIGRQIVLVAAMQLGDRDRRIDVIKGDRAAPDIEKPAQHPRALRNERTEDDRVRLLDQRAETLLEIVQPGVQEDLAQRRRQRIASRGIPGHVAFQEGDRVSQPTQLLDESAIRGRVSVPPGRRDGQTEDDDAQPTHTGTSVCMPVSTRSTSSARRA
jgi:hypothetical protein